MDDLFPLADARRARHVADKSHTGDHDRNVRAAIAVIVEGTRLRPNDKQGKRHEAHKESPATRQR